MIKGIDAQIMVQRSIDQAKVSSDKLNMAQNSHDFMAKLEKERAAREANMVKGAEKTQTKLVGKKEEHDRQQNNGDQHGRGDENDSTAKQSTPINDDIRSVDVGYRSNGLDISI